MSAYHDIKAISQSLLKLVSGPGLSQVKYWLDHWDEWRAIEPTDSMKLGSAMDCAILSPAEFERTYGASVPKSVGYEAANKALAAEGYTLIPRDEFELAQQYRRMVVADDLLGPIVQAGEAHKVVRWTESRFGYPLEMKAELDAFFMHRGVATIIDFKSTKDAPPSKFYKQADDLRWTYQAGCYTEVARRELGAERVEFYWVALHTGAIPAMYIYQPDPLDLLDALEQLHADMAALADAFSTNTWLPNVRTVSLPKWDR